MALSETTVAIVLDVLTDRCKTKGNRLPKILFVLDVVLTKIICQIVDCLVSVEKILSLTSKVKR